MVSSPTTLVIEAKFTFGGGFPAVGLTLSDIQFDLTRIGRSGNDEEILWTGKVSEGEVASSGVYYALYDQAHLDEYHYFSAARYTGAVSLDSDWFTKRYRNDV